MVDADTILSIYGKARGLLMSTFNIIITCIIAERITESVARISGRIDAGTSAVFR